MERTVKSAPSPSGPVALRLVVFADGRVTVRELPQTGSWTLGRLATCELVLDHPSVSRRHAKLTFGTVVTLEDLGSANGVVLHGTTLDAPVPLKPGDVFRIGDVKLALEAVTPARAQHAAKPLDATQPVLASTAMQAVAERVRQVAKGTITVLLHGETGTGKEVVARLLHESSPRSAGPLISVNCAALAESLLESELFGHEKGAFTGAAAARRGLLESAKGGTVFLDEVGELPAPLQPKLLRVIEEKKVLPVGGTEARPLDVRFVAATHRDLSADVKAGRFREDLFYRLAAVTVRLPPLRERPDDILPLAEHFIRGAAEQLASPVPELHQTARAALKTHPFPGNVRELRNAVERAVLLCGDGPLKAEHLELHAAATPATSPAAAPPTSGKLGDEVKELERRRVVEALEKSNGNQTRAAELLGISRRSLIEKLDAFNLPRPRKR